MVTLLTVLLLGAGLLLGLSLGHALLLPLLVLLLIGSALLPLLLILTLRIPALQQLVLGQISVVVLLGYLCNGPVIY